MSLREILESKGRQIHSIRPDATILDAVDEMCRVHVGALLVGPDRPLGIVSERDVMCRVILKRLDPATTPVSSVMTKDIVYVDLDGSAEEAMAIMTERRCRHLPVVTNAKVVGVVSIGDLARWASRDQQYEIRMLHDYVGGVYPG